MSRAIDGDALEELFREVIGGIAKKPEMDGNLEHMVRASAMVIEMIQDAPTIEPERKTGHWINIRNDNVAECDQCGITGRAWMNFCPICGADMRNAVEIARDIMHEAIDHSVWSDTVNVEEMHRVVDDKYADMRGE